LTFIFFADYSDCHFAPAAPNEIISIINNLKPKKAIRENDIDTKFLKYSNK